MATDPKDIKVKNVPNQVHQDLTNISKNLGISVTALIKPKLKELTDSYSADMKRIK